MSAAPFFLLERSPRTGPLAAVAQRMVPATAQELDRAALTRRYDRKFILGAGLAERVLSAITDDYRVVLAGDERFALYDTVYFDTPSLRSFHEHRRGRRPRFKLRIRNYLDRDLSMLEYKEKTARGDTRKLRWERASLDTTLGGEDLARLRKSVPSLFAEGDLVPAARTVFYRLMILNTASVERATLDFNLVLEHGGQQRTLDHIVVVEVKDLGRGASSPLVAALRAHHARANSFSKYCLAIAQLGNERTNTFRPSLRAIEGAL